MAKDGSRNKPTPEELANPAPATLIRLAALQTTSEETNERVGALERTIRGSNGDIGVMTRLDRVERWVASNTWFQRAVIAAIAAVAVAALWKAMGGPP